jgi:heptosyltransferase III
MPFMVTLASRADRLGDLVLTLPALQHLKRSSPSQPVILHCSEYAEDLGLCALENGLCDGILFRSVTSGQWIQKGPDIDIKWAELLCFFQGPEFEELRKSRKFSFSMGPRTRLSSLWKFSKTLRQRRSRVERSEMEYNLELAEAFLSATGKKAAEFKGLPALKLPDDWRTDRVKASTVAVFLNNGASARNAPMEFYVDRVKSLLAQGFRVDLHYSGVGAAELLQEIPRRFPLGPTLEIREAFPRLRDLMSYLSQVEKVIASSTGPLHLAHALGVPVFGYYPRHPKVQSFQRWRPHGYWTSAAVEFLEF